MTLENKSTLGFDPDALRQKYRQERDKRLRADGNDQYREVVGRLSRATSTTRTWRPVSRARRSTTKWR